MSQYKKAECDYRSSVLSVLFGKVRSLQLDGEPYFVGKDVAEILGYSDTNKAIAMHVDDEDKLNDKTALSLGQRGGWLINESGLYSLILGSKLPTANNKNPKLPNTAIRIYKKLIQY